MTRRLLILISAFAVLGAACTNRPQANVELGSGSRFVPTVADAIDNVGSGDSVAVSADGQPYLSYFGYKATPQPGAIPIPRPVGSPNVPGVLVTTEKDGLWTRGAAAMVGAGPSGLTIPFGPVVLKSGESLTPATSNGTDIVVDPSGGLHIVWTDGSGVWYADGSTAFAAKNVLSSGITLTQAGPFGWPSVAVDDSGTAWVAVAATSGVHQDVHVIQDPAGKAIDQVIAQFRSCNGCPGPQRTAIGMSGGTPVVAYVDTQRRAVAVTTFVKGGGWSTQDVETGVDASGLSMTVDGKGGIDLLYYAGSQVHLASASSAEGSWSVANIANAGTSGATTVRTTGIDADDKGTVYATWFDATTNTVVLESSTDGKTFTPIDTRDTIGGQQPDVAVSPDGSHVFLSWYDPVNQDMVLGMYGDFGAMEVANPSPLPTVVPGGATGACSPTKPSLDLIASGTTWDTNCLAANAGQKFTVTVTNQDAPIAHDFSIYPDSAAAGAQTNALSSGLSKPDTSSAPTPYDVSPLKPGTYYFQCDFHPTVMFGTFVVLGGKK